MTSRAFQYCMLILASVSLASAATSGRRLLSDEDSDSGLLVTYWGQNSAAPRYQEPELDEVLPGSMFAFVLLFMCRNVRSTLQCYAGLCTVQHHSHSFFIQIW